MGALTRRRIGLALGLWRLLRHQSRVCRHFPIAGRRRDPTGGADAARWLGLVRIGNRSHHALLCPPPGAVTYRLLAAPRSTVEAWCGFLPADAVTNRSSVEFVITARVDGLGSSLTRRLRLDPPRSRSDERWHRLALALGNVAPQTIELTLSTRLAEGGGDGPASAIWGEPQLKWRRPGRDVRRVFHAAFSQLLQGGPLAAGRTLHGRLSESSHPPLYDMWLAQRTPSENDLARMRTNSASFPYRPLVSVVTPVYNTDSRWLRACIESVKAQAYPHWQLCLADDGSTRQETLALLLEYQGDPRITVHRLAQNRGIAQASNAALDLAQGEFVALLDHDDEITPDALFEVVAYLNQHPDTDFIYSDEDKLELDGSRSGPYFKPDWSPEHFLNNMYATHLVVVRRMLLQQIQGFRPGYEGAQDYDLVLRLMDRTTRIRHLPKVLYHWRKIPESTASAIAAKPFADDAGKRALQDYYRRNDVNAEVLSTAYPCFYRTRFAIRGEPLVSIVLPPLADRDPLSPDARDVCDRTVRTLLERTRYRRFEVLLPAASGNAGSAQEIVRHLPGREVPVDADVIGHRTTILNQAASRAEGEHLLFLDWGLAATDDDWLAALLEYSQQEPIGAVGGKLIYPDGSLEHIGLLVGVNGAAASALHRHPSSSPGYWGNAIIARNCSAVSGACLMTRRHVFEQAGGFREELHWFADVDYGLRITSAGHRVVFTPHAALVHSGPFAPVAGDTAREEERRLRALWGDRLQQDPYYNPNLSRDSPDYEPDLSFQSA
jgi:GT2 family glycosyltransferase